jgi:hypothetical protein
MTETSNNETTSEASESSIEGAEATVTLIDKGDVVLKLDSITDGQWKGFRFYVPAVKSVEAAIRHFTAQSQGGKDGEEIITGLINSALAARSRSRANSKLTCPNKIDGKEVSSAQKEQFILERLAWLDDPEKCLLVNETDAFEYVPGEREVDSISGLIRQQTALRKVVTDLANQMKKAKGEGNDEVFAKLKGEAVLQYAKLGDVTEEITKRQSSDLDNLKEVFGLS